MAVRTRDWLKFGALVALAFVFGLAFASTLGVPNKGGTAEFVPAAQAAGAQFQIPAAKPAADIGNAFVAVAEHVKPAAVFIKSQHVERGESQRLPPGFEDVFPQMRRRPQVEQGSGSGFIVWPAGYILTNNHVVAGAARVTVKLYDKREFTAKVVGTDPNPDGAVMRIAARTLPPVSFGNSDSTRVGEWALAVGNPLGEQFAFTVTAGIISAKGRALGGLPRPNYGIQDFIQTDAAINPGNSGGPLGNIQGQVVGINSAIASETGFYSGYGFAIPINLARTVMEQLVKTGHVERAVMGIRIEDARQEDAEAVGLKQIRGVVVESFTDRPSPAKDAGLQPGDVIVALDGQPIDNTPQLQQKVGFKKPGETVEVTVLRQGGEKKTFTVRLARAPSERDTEVASARGVKPKGDASSKEEVLGISVEPLSTEDARDPRMRPVMEQAHGGLVVTEIAPEGPAYQRLQSSDDPGGPPARPRPGPEPARQHLPVDHRPAEQTGRDPEREPRRALRGEREGMEHVVQEHRVRGGEAGLRRDVAPRERPPRAHHERDQHRPRAVGKRPHHDAGSRRALPRRSGMLRNDTHEPRERQREAEQERPMDHAPALTVGDHSELGRAVPPPEIGMCRGRDRYEQRAAEQTQRVDDGTSKREHAVLRRSGRPQSSRRAGPRYIEPETRARERSCS